ncbi:hypothetical protein [Arsenicicoccus dermatophilus]|uniref:hypothetical protein n=1 Tax=Arsenicicoccus dermatophilus TaxID=1076331 RepID=UPI001F4C93B3|nr:hypothetical protein [Arsenicicoccus dermatophilus]MCH8612350.1 hypothetical protein [Arsenicicoccus dermatophilus]
MPHRAATDVMSVMVRTAALVAACTVPVCAAVAWWWSGPRAAWSALGGGTLCLTTLTLGLLTMTMLVRGAGALVLPLGLLLYLTMVALLLVGAWRLDRWGGLDVRPFAAAAATAAVAFQAGAALGSQSSRHPVLGEEPGRHAP